jgi:uncharacterized caspase-like protein
MHRWVGLAISLAVGLCVACTARAEGPGRRVALVIGNGAYVTTGSLRNPVSDAALISQALKRSGFEVVDTQDNLGVGPFRAALRKFQSDADGAQAAVVYYAGHGIEARGKNWLIPTDAVLQSDADLEYEAIDLDLVLHATEGAQMRIVVLDACRNNPFGKTWKRGVRAVDQGLGETDADDVLIIYSAAPGQTALDGSGDNSPFALAMAQRLPQAGLPVQMLGGMVRDDVLKATADRQRPFVSASITGTPFFLVQGGAVAGGAPTPAAAAPSFDPRAMELEMWRSVESSDDPDQLKDYLARFPTGEFADVAKAKLARLAQRAARPVVVAAAPHNGPPASSRGTATPAPASGATPAGSEAAEPPAARLRLARPHMAILLDSTSQSNLDCSPGGLAQISVIRPPSHGTVTIRQSYRYPNFSPNNQRYKCNFQQVTAENVYYMPTGSTVTEDEVAIGVHYPGSGSVSYSFNIAPDAGDDPEVNRLRTNPAEPFERPSPETEGKPQNMTVFAGLRNVVFASFSLSPACEARPYTVLAVTGGGKHGATQIVPETAHAVFAEGHPYFKCDGAPVKPVKLYYTPQADYLGADFVSLDVRLPSGRKYTKTILLTVKAP